MNRNIRYGMRILVALAVFALQLCSVSAQENGGQSEARYQGGPAVSAEGWCVMDADTGEVIIASQADGQFHPASITKIMTLLVTAEQCGSLDETVVVSEAAVTELEPMSSTLSPMPRPGEVFTVRDLLYGLILKSGNECANILAEYVAGSTSAFADLMNARAQQAGAVNTHFSNPHGLDAADHLTTPYDMSRIMQAALANPTAREILSAAECTIPATAYAGQRSMTSGHSMLNGTIGCSGVFAGKTGYTRLAQSALVTAARRGDTTLIVTVMKSDVGNHYTDTAVLLDYAYALLEGSTPKEGCNVYAPQVSNASEIGFTVTWKVGAGAVRAEFPVWIEYDETDVMTRDSIEVSGNTISCQVSIADHGFRTGVYTVQAYVYDEDGNYYVNSVKVLGGVPNQTPGFLQYDGGTFYICENGTLGLQWQELEEGCYYFDYMTGRMQTGWLESAGTAYYLDPDGKLHTGWLDWAGNRYYLQAPGDRVTGDIAIGGVLYHFDSNGALTGSFAMPQLVQ